MSPSYNNVSFTSLINPSGTSTSPSLSRPQIWSMLQDKINHAERYVGSAILSTDIISQSPHPETNLPVTVREVTFREGNRRVRETVTAYEDCRVDFEQPDGSLIMNCLSEGKEGELYLTYVFQWLLPEGKGEGELEEIKKKQKRMARLAVEGTIEAMRGLVRDGKF